MPACVPPPVPQDDEHPCLVLLWQFRIGESTPRSQTLYLRQHAAKPTTGPSDGGVSESGLQRAPYKIEMHACGHTGKMSVSPSEEPRIQQRASKHLTFHAILRSLRLGNSLPNPYTARGLKMMHGMKAANRYHHPDPPGADQRTSGVLWSHRRVHQPGWDLRGGVARGTRMKTHGIP